MNSPNDPQEQNSTDQDILILCDRVCGGVADEQEIQRLEALMIDLPEVRKIYLDLAAVHLDLSNRQSAKSARELFENATRTKSPLPLSALPQTTSRRMLFCAGLAAALAAGLIWKSDFFRPAASGNKKQPSVAVLQKFEAVTWGAAMPELTTGDLFHAGQVVRIESGILKIEFACGALVMLKGPAELTLVSSDRAILNDGRLAADVPPWASGFQIDAQDIKVVDLGTQFAMSVRDGNAVNVNVVKGEVEVGSDNSTEPRKLLAGHAVQSIPGKIESREYDVSLTPLANRLPQEDIEPKVTVVADLLRDFSVPKPHSNWRYMVNEGAIGDVTTYRNLPYNKGRKRKKPCYGFRATDRVKSPLGYARIRVTSDHVISGHVGFGSTQMADGLDRYMISAYRIPSDGKYRIEAGWLVRPESRAGFDNQNADVLIHVNSSPPIFAAVCSERGLCQYRAELGMRNKGDWVYVAIGPNGVAYNDGFQSGFAVVRENSADDEVKTALAPQ